MFPLKGARFLIFINVWSTSFVAPPTHWSDLILFLNILSNTYYTWYQLWQLEHFIRVTVLSPWCSIAMHCLNAFIIQKSLKYDLCAISIATLIKSGVESRKHYLTEMIYTSEMFSSSVLLYLLNSVRDGDFELSFDRVGPFLVPHEVKPSQTQH